MPRVFGATVAVKWFEGEVRSAEARAVLASGQQIIAPDLLIPETDYTAWKNVRRGDSSREQGEAMVRALPLSLDRLAATAPLSERALERPQSFDHPAYDCFYLALAESESAVLVTDDDKLILLAKQARLGKWMKALTTFASRSK